ncbi:MAG TPA: MFS transporter [Gemmatimonadaceae bacterium]|nr:MFS transporter [Gemmatimonadaceae bacterium]
MTEPPTKGTQYTAQWLVPKMNLWRSLAGLPRDLWLFSFATFINRLGTMAIPFLILYLTRELGFSAERAGLVLGLYGVGSIVAAPISGRLADRIGGLSIIRVSLLGSGVMMLAYPFVHSFVAVVALTLAWSLLNESGRPAILTLVAEMVPTEQRKPAYALLRLAINLGMSVGPALGGFIAAHSFKMIFVANASASLVAGIFLVLVPLHSATHLATQKKGAHPESGKTLLEDRGMLVFLFASFLVSVVFFQHEGALPLFLVQDLHLSTAFYGSLFTVNTLMIVVMEVPLNAATAHWPHRRALCLGAFLFAAGSAFFGFASGPALILVGIVVWTFGEMMLFPQASAYVADAAPPNRRGAYMGAYSMAFSSAFAVAPWAGTTVFSRFGATTLWTLVFLLGLLASAIMLGVTVKKSPSPVEGEPLLEFS